MSLDPVVNFPDEFQMLRANNLATFGVQVGLQGRARNILRFCGLGCKTWRWVFRAYKFSVSYAICITPQSR